MRAVATIVLGFAPLQERIDWKENYETALVEAKEQGKRVVVYFWTEGRPLCKTLEAETLAAPEVVQALRRFICVKVDVEARPQLFQSAVGGRGGLATCVVDETGDVVSALPGFAAPEAFLRFVERAERGYAGLRAARDKSSKDPANAAALLALGQTYEALSSLRRAEECFDRGIAIAGPRSHLTEEDMKCRAVSHERLARFRTMRGRNVEARKHLDAYREIDPGNRFGRLDRAMLTEAFALYIERRREDALRIIEEARRMFPGSEEADQMLLAASMVRHELGDDARALENLDSLLKRYPESSWAPAAREQIQHIKNPPPEHQH